MRADRWRIQEIYSNRANGCVPGSDKQGRIVGAASNRGNLLPFDIPAARYGVFGHGITSEGFVAGAYIDSDTETHARIRDNQGRIETIDPPGTIGGFFGGAIAWDINKNGAVAGSYTDTTATHGFIGDNDGTFTTVDAPGATFATNATAINDDGVVAGAFFDANSVRQGYLREKNGNIDEFSVPGAGVGVGAEEGTHVIGINNGGAVTGYYFDANAVDHGYVRAADGTITTFDAPGAGTEPGTGTLALSINDEWRYGWVFHGRHVQDPRIHP
jgi:hypothetical protein